MIAAPSENLFGPLPRIGKLFPPKYHQPTKQLFRMQGLHKYGETDASKVFVYNLPFFF